MDNKSIDDNTITDSRKCSSKISNESLREKKITYTFTENSLTIRNVIVLIKDAFQLSSKKIHLYDWKGIEIIEDADLSNMTIANEARRLFFIRKGDVFENKNILRLFAIGKILGEGGFGKVYHAMLHNSTNAFAIKFLRHYNNLEIDFFYKEINLLLRLEHCNIIKLHSYCATDEGHIALIMEYASGGTLKKIIHDKGKLTEESTKEILCQILHTAKYCHNEGVIHRDLKTDNILFNDSRQKDIKIIDFGISSLLNTKTNFGSLAYISPEVLRNKDYRSLPSIDVWAIGCILYEMVTGERMFQGKNNDDIKGKILIRKVTFPSFLSIECINLINMLTNINVGKRYTIEQALSHPWFCNDKLLNHNEVVGKKRLYIKSYGFPNNSINNSGINRSISNMQEFFTRRRDMKPRSFICNYDFTKMKNGNTPRYMASIGHHKEQVRTRKYFSLNKDETKEIEKDKEIWKQKRMESCKNVTLPYLNSPFHKESNKSNSIKMKSSLKLNNGLAKL